MTPVRFADSADYSDVVRATADHFQILPELVTKDYWLTEVLRAIAANSELQGRVIFKGGTSLSKGWRLIERFSEDVDLLVTGPDFGPAPETKSLREKVLKRLKPAVETQLPLRIPIQGKVSSELFNWQYMRNDWFCNLRFVLPGLVPDVALPPNGWILLEAGFRGGANPHAMRPIKSLIAAFLETKPDAKKSLSAFATEFASFEMALLKPERTFAEKLLLVHAAFLKGGDGIAKLSARHYYDLSQLLRKSTDVNASLNSGAISALIRDAAAVTKRFFGDDPQIQSLDIENMDIASSPALRPDAAQLAVLRATYLTERDLYGPSAPSFAQIMADASAIADRLR